MPHAESKPHIIMIHGNGGGDSNEAWLPEVARQLRALGLTVSNESFPDPVKARASFWLPRMHELGAGANTIIIGYSSGAVAAMRFAEQHQIFASVLVGASYTDLGEASERVSGYFEAPWKWQTIRNNQHWILQFASPTDPYIPISEPRFIQKQLQTKYYELENRGHFQDNSFPELVKAIKKQLDL
jgi:predicted alpha/beta hydrolase family esterase